MGVFGGDFDPGVVYAFMLEFPGMETIPITEVSGMNMEVKPIPYKSQVGDKFISSSVPGQYEGGQLTVKALFNKSTKPYFDWFDNIKKSGDIVLARKDGSLVFLKPSDKAEQARWNFTNAWPTKIEMSAVKPGGAEPVTVTITIKFDDVASA